MTRIGLCKGRHPMPVDNYIFNDVVNPLDPTGLEEEAKSVLSVLDCSPIQLYVSGLTVALIAALNAAKVLEIEVVLMHFDRDNGTYYEQPVR